MDVIIASGNHRSGGRSVVFLEAVTLDVLTMMNNPPNMYGVQESQYETRKRSLAKGVSDTLASMDDLAMTYSKQGRWREAEKIQAEMLETCKAALPPAHPDTLASMNNLALVHSGQGRWDEAQILGLEVMESNRAMLSEGHPSTLTSIAN